MNKFALAASILMATAALGLSIFNTVRTTPVPRPGVPALPAVFAGPGLDGYDLATPEQAVVARFKMGAVGDARGYFH